MRPDGSFHATPPMQQQHSSWHSPVPYLFGGLAAMLGLIAFALLLLACSYWKLSGYLDDNGGQGEQDRQEGEKPLESIKVCRELEVKIVVIMAGDQKPTFIATPMCSKNSSFNDRKEGEEVKTSVADGSDKKPGDEHQQPEPEQTEGGNN